MVEKTIIMTMEGKAITSEGPFNYLKIRPIFIFVNHSNVSSAKIREYKKYLYSMS